MDKRSLKSLLPLVITAFVYKILSKDSVILFSFHSCRVKRIISKKLFVVYLKFEKGFFLE